MRGTSWVRSWVGAVAGAAVVVGGSAVLAPPALAADPPGTPRGNFEEVIVYEDGTVQVLGWAIDPDTPDPVYVWVTTDGADGHHIYADAPRPDVGAVFPDHGPDHGIDVEGFPEPGPHTICMTIANVGPGVHKPLGCVDFEVPRLDPFGNFERVRAVPGGIEITGWAIDPEVPDPIFVWVTVDGAGRHLYANQYRADLETAFPFYGGDHGFKTTRTAAPGPHTVCVTASNVFYGEHTPLGCRTITVPDPNAPVGNLESARAAGGGIEVKGWTFDPNDPTRPIYVWVTVDGVGRHLLANATRDDVAAVHPSAGAQHGFLGVVPASPGQRRVCVTGSNIGPGSHTLLGCRTVTVP